MDVGMKKTKLNIGGMTCVNCQNRIEKALNRTDGIIGANVSYGNGTADVMYDETGISLREIIDVIEDLYYEVIQSPKPVGPDMTDKICLSVIIVAAAAVIVCAAVVFLVNGNGTSDGSNGMRDDSC